jgi:manganese-dependent inorganic pyrophosphatase
MDGESPLVVVGHKNPDTDSICSAVAYARYKEHTGTPALPYRAGTVNTQTRYVLERFDCPPPALLTSLYPSLRDIMIPKESLYIAGPEAPLSEAARIILDNDFSFLPVADADGRCLGKITVLRICRLLDELPKKAAGTPVETAIAEAMAQPISHYLEKPEALFRATDLVRDVERRINEFNVGGFVVTDEEERIAGVVARVNFLNKTRFRVVLVDHNELSQTVDGVEDAEIVEIIDHHRIGARSTTMPITFINRVVGSTATIVADTYRRANMEPDHQTAALLLSALLSDTVILKSPTTTAIDRETAAWLGEIAGLEVEVYGEEMFQAGSEIAALTPRQIVEQDQKRYAEVGRRFAVSQIEMVGFKAFDERQEEVAAAVAQSRGEEGLDFACLMVTDITEETTRLVFDGAKRIADAIHYPQVAPGVYEMTGVVSRKKQVLPYLIDLLKSL